MLFHALFWLNCLCLLACLSLFHSVSLSHRLLETRYWHRCGLPLRRVSLYTFHYIGQSLQQRPSAAGFAYFKQILPNFLRNSEQIASSSAKKAVPTTPLCNLCSTKQCASTLTLAMRAIKGRALTLHYLSHGLTAYSTRLLGAGIDEIILLKIAALTVDLDKITQGTATFENCGG